MKVVTIDFSHETPVVSTHYSGELGEHQAVTLHIIPEDNMQRDEDIAFYYVLFTVEGGLVASRTYEPGEDIDVALWGQLTEQRNFSCQLIGTNGLETIIAKSPVINLSLGKSLDGTVIGIDDNRDSLIAMIGAFNERLTDDEVIISQLQADGQGDLAQTDTEALDYIRNKRVSLLTNDAEYITVDGVRYRQIWGGGTQVKWTGGELSYLFGEMIPLAYNGHPIIGISWNSPYYRFWFFGDSYGFSLNYIEVRGDSKEIKDGYAKIGGVFRDDDALMTFYERADEISFVTNGAVYKYLTDNYYKKAAVEALIPKDTGDLTNNAGFITVSDVKYTELKKTGSTLNYTGNQILTMAGNKQPLCYNGFPVVDVHDTSTNAIIHYVEGNILKGISVALDSASSQSTVGGYIVEPSLYTKLSGGEVAEGNTKFVTGDQVYQAIQAALNN